MPQAKRHAHPLSQDTSAFHGCRFVIGWRHPSPRGRCAWHAHDDLEIVYHPKGRGETYCADGSHFAYQPDSIVIYPPGIEHDQVMFSDGDDWCVQMHIPADLAASCDAPWSIDALDSDVLRSDLRHLTRPALHLDSLDHAADHARAIALLTSLLARRHANHTATNDIASQHLEQACRYMQRHLAAIDSLQTVAAHCGIGADRLRRIFVERLGLPPKRWLTERRLQRAKELLRHSTLTLREIASHCGFAHERHFSDCFRQEVGRAPGHWRREPF